MVRIPALKVAVPAKVLAELVSVRLPLPDLAKVLLPLIWVIDPLMMRSCPRPALTVTPLSKFKFRLMVSVMVPLVVAVVVIPALELLKVIAFPLRVKLLVWPTEPLLVKRMVVKFPVAARLLIVTVCVFPAKVRVVPLPGRALLSQFSTVAQLPSAPPPSQMLAALAAWLKMMRVRRNTIPARTDLCF